jgi:hypothetical protein
MNTFKQFKTFKPINPLLSPPPRVRGRKGIGGSDVETFATV